MNKLIRNSITSVPILKEAYYKARSLYNERRIIRAASKVFKNIEDYRRALIEERLNQRIDLYTYDGLRFTVRQNRKDAIVLAEIFLDSEYTYGFQLPENPIIIDIGGYIGDFAVYAAKYLKAKKVITIEPSIQNFTLLEANINNNNYQNRIIALHKAVTDGNPVKMNIDTAEAGQWRVSAYYESSHDELKEVAGISLEQIIEDYNLPTIDLLKIDCEGGEYMILLTTPSEILCTINNIIFEYHEIDNFTVMLAQAKERLMSLGFVLNTCGRGENLISATRL